MIAVPGGDGGGCWLRGAAVTSPGEPRTASRQAGGLRAGGGWWVGSRRRAPGRVQGEGDGVWRLGPAALAGSRALGLSSDSGSAPLATRARPSLSLAPPPRHRRAGQTHRRAPTEVAGNVCVGHPGRWGTAAEGAGRDRESSADRRGCDWEAWGASLAPPRLLAGEPSRGHPHPRLTDVPVPGTHRSRGVQVQGAPSFFLLRVKPGTAAPSPRAEAACAALRDAPRPGSREIRGEPGDPRPRGAGGCAAPAPTGLFQEDANHTPRILDGKEPSLTGSETPRFLTSVLAERLVILGPSQASLD
ncbi:uncharacterized protein LOC141585494 [Saimiri boliviensis]|uniref:uncharacterized protein LOC141585494 n=1 Tax=Saimiri boliviensis TaxID=27679 RepID=UPI003D7740F5